MFLLIIISYEIVTGVRVVVTEGIFMCAVLFPKKSFAISSRKLNFILLLIKRSSYINNLKFVKNILSTPQPRFFFFAVCAHMSAYVLVNEQCTQLCIICVHAGAGC